MRAETGPMRFGGDWCGVFIRGDNAILGYAYPLREFLRCVDAGEEVPWMIRSQVNDLVELLESAAEGPDGVPGVQQLPEWDRCQVKNAGLTPEELQARGQGCVWNRGSSDEGVAMASTHRGRGSEQGAGGAAVGGGREA